MAGSDKRTRKKENARAAREAREAAARRARRNRTLVRVGILVAIFAAVVALVSILNDDDDTEVSANSGPSTTTTSLPALVKTECNDEKPPDDPDRPRLFDAAPSLELEPDSDYSAIISTSCGDIGVDLDEENAPIAVNNFVFLAKSGFYDGLSWHRVVKDFVIQGGDPKNGKGGPGYTVSGEGPDDNYPYDSNAAAKGSADGPGAMGSQFFIVTGENGTVLPNDYARFGVVTQGLDVARTLESFATPTEEPSRDLYIFKIVIIGD